MTSTSFNIGLNGGEKNSSRVLRPPGGGHSDIFGVRDKQNELTTPSKKRNQPQSTIKSCFNLVVEESDQTKETKNTTNGEGFIREEQKNKVDNEIDENMAPGGEMNKKKDEQSTPVPRRGRVPPGGFSSALW